MATINFSNFYNLMLTALSSQLLIVTNIITKVYCYNEHERYSIATQRDKNNIVLSIQ